MTVREVFLEALAVMGVEEADSADYQMTVTPLCNLLLSELFDINNSMRLDAGLEPLTHAPVLAGLADEVPYEFGLCMDTMPFGMATYLYAEENQSLASFFNAKYEEGKRRRTRAIVGRIEDVYASGGDA